MAAALETLKIVRESDYLEHIQGLGERLRTGLAERASAAGFGFRQTGPVTMPLLLFDDDKDMRLGFRWCSAMLERGIYTHPWHNMFLCAAMTASDIDQTLVAAEGAFKVLKGIHPFQLLPARSSERSGHVAAGALAPWPAHP